MKETIRLALIKGKKVQYDTCVDEVAIVNRIPGLAARMDYLGEGKIHSIDEVPYSGKEERLHFWKMKETK